VGPFSPHERESNKEKDAQGSELPATFLPTIPMYPFPVLAPQAPKHMEPMSPQAQPDTKGGSSAPSFTLPLGDQRQAIDQTVPPQLLTRPMAPNVPFVPSQQTLKNVEPQDALVEPIQLNETKSTAVPEAPTTDAKTATLSQAFADSQATTNSPTLDDV